MKRPSVFDYLDYRSFLGDLFQYRKGKDRHFSYRYFAGKAGFSAPNFLQLVITGQRNLTPSSIAKVARGFVLKKKERDFFETLVFMNQADDHDERNRFYRRMMSLRGTGASRRMEKAAYEYFSRWYFPVIREVVVLGARTHTAAQIAGMLKPAVKPKEAQRALDLLTELGLILKDSRGCWEQCDQVVSTGPEVKSLVVANFHREMMRLAAESIERFPADRRDVSALTISCREGRMEEIKERIAAFRQEMLDLACAEDEAGQVMQINIQAFPLTET